VHAESLGFREGFEIAQRGSFTGGKGSSIDSGGIGWNTEGVRTDCREVDTDLRGTDCGGTENEGVSGSSGRIGAPCRDVRNNWRGTDCGDIRFDHGETRIDGRDTGCRRGTK
jgi:hypothetical protein